MSWLSEIWDAGTDIIGDVAPMIAAPFVGGAAGAAASLAPMALSTDFAMENPATTLGLAGLAFGIPSFGPSMGGGGGAAAGSASMGGGGFASWLPGILGIGSGLFGMNEARKLSKLNADPFGSQREYYQQQLA